MQTSTKIDDHKGCIMLSGNFTFESHREFKQATTAALEVPGLTELEMDFSAVDYMDSAALGMLLLLNERANGRKVTLLNCRGMVKAVLEIANFGKIFEIKQ